MKRTFTLRAVPGGGYVMRRPDGATQRVASLAAVNTIVAATSPLLAATVTGGAAEDRTPFYAVLALVGVETNEDAGWGVRMFDAVEPRGEFPLPLWWEDSSMHGDGEFALVGRIDEFHVDGMSVLATGSFDNSLDAAQRAIAGIANGADAVSVDVSFPEPTVDECTEWDPDDPFWCTRPRMRAPLAAIGGATMCGLGAFPQARIALDAHPAVDAEPAPPAVERPECTDCGDEDGEIIVIAADGGPQPTVRAVTAALAAPVHRAEFFRRPDELQPGQPLTVTPEGRVYGYAYSPEQCHRGYPGSCVTPPAETDFSEFLLTPVTLDDGSRVMAGPVTFHAGHADTNPGTDLAAARAHYDNSAWVAGLVTMGHDEHGDWYSGALRPDLTEADLWEITACGQLSGDWRPVGTTRRLCALHVVPNAGYPQRLAASAAPAATRPGGVIVPGPDRLAFVERQYTTLAREVAELRPLRELYGAAGDAIVASLAGRP